MKILAIIILIIIINNIRILINNKEIKVIFNDYEFIE